MGPQPEGFVMALKTTDEARAFRFWRKVLKGGENDCWEWGGAKGRDGYGVVFIGPSGAVRQHKAHRVSFSYATGPIPEGLCVLHKCDNPPCVNPAHLFLGTRAENNADKVAKGRQPHNMGEANPRAKLTRADAEEIRKMLDIGHTQTEIAKCFGVAQGQISRVKAGYLE